MRLLPPLLLKYLFGLSFSILSFFSFLFFGVKLGIFFVVSSSRWFPVLFLLHIIAIISPLPTLLSLSLNLGSLLHTRTTHSSCI